MIPQPLPFSSSRAQADSDPFSQPVSKYRITIDSDCDNCGLCITPAPMASIRRRPRPRIADEHLCLGPACQKNYFFCVARCPREAISLRPNPSFEILGDKRWTAELLASTWHMAETGDIPHTDLNYKTGDSGGGFDKLRLVFPAANAGDCPEEDLPRSTSTAPATIGPQITIPSPLFRGHVLRLGQYRFHALPGPGGEGLGNLLLHRGGGISGGAETLRRPYHHPGGHRALRGAGRDHPAGSDRGIQICPGRQTGLGRPSSRRQGHPGGGPHERGGGREAPFFSFSLSQRLLRGGPQETRGLDQRDQSPRPWCP